MQMPGALYKRKNLGRGRDRTMKDSQCTSSSLEGRAAHLTLRNSGQHLNEENLGSIPPGTAFVNVPKVIQMG